MPFSALYGDKFTSMPHAVAAASSKNGIMNAHCTVTPSVEIPFAVTLNGWPNGRTNPVATVRTIANADSNWVTSVMIGKTVLPARHPMNSMPLSTQGPIQ